MGPLRPRRSRHPSWLIRGNIAADGTVRVLAYADTPRFLQIETNLACNARCPFCPYVHVTRGPRVMADWIWREIVDETRGWGVTYRPFLINEPLTDPRLFDIIRTIRRDATAKVEIHTNGGLLNEHRAAALLESGIDVVRLSIDGFSRETHASARVGVDYDTVLRNANRLIELRDAGDYPTRIEVRCIDMPHNRHEQAAYVDYWTPRADEVVLTPLYDWPWTGQTRSTPKPCLKILDEMFLYTDGTAPLCCWDQAGRGLIRDVKTQTVREIWDGPRMQKMRQLLNRGRRDQIELCSRCNAHETIDFVGFESSPGRRERTAVRARAGRPGSSSTVRPQRSDSPAPDPG